jgi:hypothetical protein
VKTVLCCFWIVLPCEVLPRGGLQILDHVEAGVLAQKRVAEKRNEVGGLMAGGKVLRRKPRGFCDLLLAIAGIKEGVAKLSRRAAWGIIALGQARQRHVKIAVQVDRERALALSAMRSPSLDSSSTSAALSGSPHFLRTSSPRR